MKKNKEGSRKFYSTNNFKKFVCCLSVALKVVSLYGCLLIIIGRGEEMKKKDNDDDDSYNDDNNDVDDRHHR